MHCWCMVGVLLMHNCALTVGTTVGISLIECDSRGIVPGTAPRTRTIPLIVIVVCGTTFSRVGQDGAIAGRQGTRARSVGIYLKRESRRVTNLTR